MVMLPLIRRVMSLLTDRRAAHAGGEPVTLRSVTDQLLDEFPHLIFHAEGSFSTFSPRGDNFEECMRSYISACGNLSTLGLESPRLFDEDIDEDAVRDVSCDSGNERGDPAAWHDNGWCSFHWPSERPISAGQTAVY